MGFLDDTFGENAVAFVAELKERAKRLAQDPDFRAMLRRKHERRLDDESVKPLAAYRAEELERMRVNFFGPDPAYHEARRRFVFKGNPQPRGGRVPVLAAAEGTSWFPARAAARAGAQVPSAPVTPDISIAGRSSNAL